MAACEAEGMGSFPIYHPCFYVSTLLAKGWLMLVLSRKKGESIFIGDVKVTIVDVRGDRVRVGIEAPKETPIARAELKSPEEIALLEKRLRESK